MAEEKDEGKKKRKARFYGVTAKAERLIDGGKGVFMGADHVTEGEKAQVEIERKVSEVKRPAKASVCQSEMTKDKYISDKVSLTRRFANRSL